MKKLRVIAGKSAYQHIKEKGLAPNDIRAVVAAAGGPKWFTTYGLVQSILSKFLEGAGQDIDFMGSSVGSWQMVTALTSDPAAALERLRMAYAGHIYSENPSKTEISEASHGIVRAMIADEINHILSHNTRNIHVITSRGKGILSKNTKAPLISGFAYTFVLNAIARKGLNQTLERVIFSSSHALPFDNLQDDLSTRQVLLEEDNIIPALRASAAIPIMIDPIYDIKGGPKGAYWDGGTTDYHISVPYHYDSGIVLHPHFGPDVMPGWFDKKGIRRRRAKAAYMDKVLLLCPSVDYINTLPRKQISDLKDFYFFGTDQQARIDYWNEISNRSLELGDEFLDLIATDRLAESIEPYTEV